jgi:hypothetical protein
MKIKINVTPDNIGQILDDMAYANSRMRQGDDVINPFTLSVLHEITEKAEAKSVEMMREATEFSEVFNEMSGKMAVLDEVETEDRQGDQEEVDPLDYLEEMEGGEGGSDGE